MYFSATFGAENISRGVARCAEEPRDQRWMVLERSRFLRESEKNHLGDILGERRIVGETEGGGVDPVNVASGDLVERRFTAGMDVIAEKVVVGRDRYFSGHRGSLHLQNNIRCARNRTGKMRGIFCK